MSSRPIPVEASPASGRGYDAAIVAVAVGLCVAAYANTLRGEFVYDDAHQIVDNSLVQDPRLFWKGLTSDVWAYKGDKKENQAWSNYWRPTFFVWLVLNHRLWSLASTLGWHATNILLHAAVTGVAYGLLRQLRVTRAMAAAIVFLFAVHPVHVETVAWISGCTDMLLALPMLGALWCVLSARERRDVPPLTPPLKGGERGGAAVWKWTLAILLYAITTLAKEASVLFPVIAFAAVFFTEWSKRRPVEGSGATAAVGQSPAGVSTLAYASRRDPIISPCLRIAAAATLPFVAVAAAYLGTRQAVLQMASIKVPWALTWAGLMTTAPSVVAFYLRQIVFPWWIGPMYPLRPITPQQVGLLNFLWPLAIVVGVVVVFAWLSRRDAVRQVGLVLCFVPLAPSLYVNAFTPEQIVHDRYLYLPLLGALMVLIPTACSALERLGRLTRPRAERACLIGAAACCIPLGVQTVRYNTAWLNELSLWAWAIESDPSSASGHAQYGTFLMKAKRNPEAKREFDESLRLRPKNQPLTDVLFNRSTIAIAEGRIEDAERDLSLILSKFPEERFEAYSKLAQCYMLQQRFDAAEAILRQGRKAAPFAQCLMTDNLAVVLHESKRPGEALRELEAYRPLLAKELGPQSRMLLFHLGSLYLELGRTEDARGAFQQYVDETALFENADPEVRNTRRQLQQWLRQQSGGAAGVPKGR